MDNLILVGFGKQKIVDLIEKIGNKEGEEELLNLVLGQVLPPIYRVETSCTQEEVLAFLEFTGWLSDLYKKNAPVAEKER